MTEKAHPDGNMAQTSDIQRLAQTPKYGRTARRNTSGAHRGHSRGVGRK